MFNPTFNNQQLPVSPTDVDQTFHCPGAPFQLPFKNAFPEIVNGYVVKMLQDNAFKNPLRVFLFNMASSNAWQNELYSTLLASTMSLAEALAATTQGQSQEQLVLNAANEVTTCATALLANQYPQLKQMMGAGIETEIQRLMQRHQQIANLVAQTQQPQQNQWGGQQQQPQNFNQPQQGDWPQNNQPQWNNQRGTQGPAANPNVNWGRFAGVQSTIQAENQGFNPNANGYQGRTGLSAQPVTAAQPTPVAAEQPVTDFSNTWGGRSSAGKQWPAPAAAPAPAHPSGAAGVVEEMFQDMGNASMQPPVENARQRAFAETVQKQAVVATPPKPVVEPYVEPVANPSPGGVSNHDDIDETRPYDVVKLDSGVEIRPAHSSGWERTWSIENPWPMAFDPNTHMKFHVRTPQADGSFVVKEVVKLIAPTEKDAMEYLQHEVKSRKPYVLDPSKRTLPVDWQEVANLDKPQVTHAEDGAEVPVEEPVVKILPEEISASSYLEAEIKYLDGVIGLGSENFEGAVREYYYRDMMPVNVDGNMIGVMVELSKKTTLSAAASFLREHLENEEITPRLYNLLNTELTKRTNQALAVNLGYGSQLQIIDFVMDINDLGDALHEDAMGLLWSLLNNERAVEIIHAVTNILKGEEYWEYLGHLGKYLNKEHKGEVMQILARYELNSVTHVEWNLDIFAEGTGQVLKAAENPEFHRAMVALLGRTTKIGRQFSHHYVVDVNNRVLEVMPGYLGTNSVLIRAVELV